MTKVIILGQEPKGVKCKKIEFVKSLLDDCSGFYDTTNDSCQPDHWENIELICKGYDYGEGYDLMYAYTDDRNSGVLYFGYFNDGIV